MESRRANEAVSHIDEFFALEERTSEEDKLRYGLRYGVEHGILTEDEAIECERAYLQCRDTSPDQAPRSTD